MSVVSKYCSHLVLGGIRILILLIWVNRDAIEDEVVLPALVYLVEPVLDVIVGQGEGLQLGSRDILVRGRALAVIELPELTSSGSQQ